MAAVTLTIEPDELLGLRALAKRRKAADDGGAGTDADAVAAARVLLRTGLAEELTEAGLPWAPPEEPAASQEPAATAQPATQQAAKPATGAPGPAGTRRLWRDSAYVLAIALIVTLWGSYADGWRWTGFRTNGQLWDWLNLLLLPVVTGAIPLWVQYKKYISRGRAVLYGAVLAAWTGFVIAGYVIPLRWTGFSSQTLWNWIELLLLPTVVAGTMALTSLRLRPAAVFRSLRPYQRAILAALAAGWVVTVIGGYALRWTWTGYPQNNTLWDWLQLLLLPLVFPTVLLPALLNWITGNASVRAASAGNG